MTAFVSFALETIKRKDDIKLVFLVFRGPIYMDHNTQFRLTYKVFGDLLQRTVTELAQAGKKVCIVSENPELPFNPRDYAGRPFRPDPVMPILSKDTVLAHQKEYLEALSSIEGATLINSQDIFFQNDGVLVMRDGKSFYHDDNHLSDYGSEYQARAQFADIIDQLAATQKARPPE